MKALAFDPSLCDGNRACEVTCATTWYKVADGRKSSIRISETAGVFSARFCIQCGACVEVCPTNALVQTKDGVVHVRKNVCVGCMACVGFCPYDVMYFDTGKATAFKCIACGKCVDTCPTHALQIIDVDAGSPDLWNGTALRTARADQDRAETREETL